MKFLADMGISPATVEFLCHLGHDGVHLHALKLGQLPDPLILAKARHEGRILLTHDLDFGELLAASGSHLPSVIIFRLRDMRPANVNHHLRVIIAQYADALSAGAVLSVTEARIRVRSLPVK